MRSCVGWPPSWRRRPGLCRSWSWAHRFGKRPPFRHIQFSMNPPEENIGFAPTVERFPFVPSDESRLEQDCYEAYNIQVAGLVQRLRAIKSQRVVIGVSGGLDSTHALIVAAKAMNLLGRPRTNILAYTMLGFATGTQSKSQAWALMRALEVSSQELDIRPTATQMFKDMGHPFGQGEPVYDITFENVQAGLRTDYLFRLANHQGASSLARAIFRNWRSDSALTE
jgi:NAD+ synthase (glutamine-hydrolysing)